MTGSLFPTPACTTAAPAPISGRVGFLPGAGNWLARVRFCVARQPFSFRQARAAQGRDGVAQGRARVIVVDGLDHDRVVPWAVSPGHGTEFGRAVP